MDDLFFDNDLSRYANVDAGFIKSGVSTEAEVHIWGVLTIK